jgi:LysM repeat protein
MKTEMNRQDQADSLRDEVEKAAAEKLPSRSEIHAEKRNRTKWKFNFPIVRLLGIAFLLIPITILVLHFNNKEENVLKSIFPINGSVESYEQINIPSKTNNKEKIEFDRNEEEEKTVVEEEEAKPKGTSVETINTNTQTSNGKTTPAESKPEPPSVATEPEETEEVIEEEKIEENVEYVEHVVASGETLYRISMKYYNSRAGEQIISDYNNLINQQVNAGQKLTIPIKKNG